MATKSRTDIPLRVKNALEAVRYNAEMALETGRKPVWYMRRLREEIAQPLLDRFQRRVRQPVELHYCNTEHWLTGQNELRLPGHKANALREVWRAAEALALKQTNAKGNWTVHRNERRMAERFPELVHLAWLCLELDAAPFRPVIGDMKPRTKPYGH